MESFIDTFEHILGLNADTLAWWQLLLRAALIYGVGLGLVRIGKRRFMGTYTAFDMILGITVGALLASAAADSSLFLNAIGIVFALVVLHWVLAFVTYNWDVVEMVLIGDKQVIIEDGEVNEQNTRRTRISSSDIGQALRKAGVNDVKDVRIAYLERNGELSIVPRDDETQEEDEEPRNKEWQRDGEQRDSSGTAPSEQLGTPKILEIDVQEGVQKVVVELR